MIRHFWLIAFSISLIVGATANAQTANAPTQTAPADSSAAVVGKWTGTYDGASSGNFELAIGQDANRKLTGQVVMVAPDGNRYPITLKTITYRNGQLSAGYTDPQNGEVRFTGKPDSAGMKGTWDSNDGQGTGNWQVTRASR